MSLTGRGLTLCRPALDLLFPQHCGCCCAPSSKWLCDACSAAVAELANSPRCPICGSPLAMADAPCPRCEGRPRRLIVNVACLGTHSGPVRELIHRLKYSHQWGLAEPLADLLAQQVTVHTLIAQADVLVPVPLHWRRRMSRGYNQSELLARSLAKDAKIGIVNALERMRDTPHQTAIRSLSQRARNVKDAFRLRPAGSKLTGKKVILVDDVYTTGATMRSAARALKAAQVARIDAIVLAIADPKSRDFQTIPS